jgi:hypothetical protein
LGKLLKSRFAVSSIVAVLIAILLISTFTAALLYISMTQMQSAQTGTETTGEISERLRENLKATLLNYNSSTRIATFNVTNTGEVPLAISYVLLINPDRSLTPVPVRDENNPGRQPVRIIPLESKVFNVNVTLPDPISNLGLQTERGNVFTVMVSGAVTTQAPFDFSVSLSPSSGSVTPGGSATATVTVTLVSGSPATVSLSASGLPSGTTATLSPSSGTPTFTSTLTIATSSSTPTGTYTISITGTGGSLSRSTSYTLTVATATYTVTFTQTGLPSGTSWSVTFGSQTQSSTSSTITFTNIPAGTYSWSVSPPISGGSGVRYVASPASGSLSVPSQTSQTITYTTEYQWTFYASGLGSDASGTVVTIDGTNYAYSGLPVSFWWSSGSTHSYSYQQYVSTTTSGKRYANHNPPSATVTVSGTNSLNPAYHTEHQLTISVSPSGAGTTTPSPGSYWYDSGSSVTVSETPSAGYTFSYWSLDGINVGSTSSYTVTMGAPHTLTAVFTGATYTLTVYVYKEGTTNVKFQGIPVKVDGTTYYTDSQGKVSVSVSYGSHTVEVVSPYDTGYGFRFVFVRWGDGSTANPRTISVTADAVLNAYDKRQNYLTMQVNPFGAGTVSPGSGWHDEGEVVTISARPSTGYRFDSWSGSGSGSYKGTSSQAQVTMNAPITETANFVAVATVTFSTSGMGSDALATMPALTVDGVSYYRNQLPKSFTWDVGSTHSFEWAIQVVAQSLDKAYAWMSTSGLSTSRSGTINTPQGGGSIIGNYITQYKVKFQTSGLGSDIGMYSVSIAYFVCGNIYAVDKLVYDGSPDWVWADSGTTCSWQWRSPIDSTQGGKRYVITSTQSGSVTVDSVKTITATYKTQYRLTASVSPSGAGSVSLNPSSADGYYDSGTSVTATAQASAGYTFSKWQLDGSDYSTSNPTSVSMNAPHSLTAVFTGATYTLTIYVYRSGTATGISGVTVKVDGAPYTTGSSGKVQVTVSYGSHTVEVVSPYSPSSGTRYVFTQWSDGSASNPRTISVTASTTLTAYMKLQYQLTVAVNPSGGGSVSASPSSSDGYYDSGTSVTLTATANSGYAFDAWAGDASGTSSSTSVSMSAPKSVTANFFTFSISVSPTSGSTPAGGSVTATVTVTYVSGVNSKTVSLSASGLPSGASASFDPSSVTISPSSTTATSTMTITTSASTPTGTYTVTVTGTGGGLSKSTPYTLTVTAAVYTVSFYVYDDAGSAVSGATINFAGSSYSHGGSTSVTAGTYSLSTGTIPSGYRFNKWDTGGSVSVASSTSSSTTATVSGSGSITMRLQRVATVTFSASGLSSDFLGTVLTGDGVGYSNPSQTFTWDVGSTHSFTWSSPLSTTRIERRYVWVSTSGLSTAKSGTITVPSGGGSVSATYKAQYTLTISVNPPGGGSTKPAPGTYWYDDGATVDLSATPNSGYVFDKWTGTVTSTFSQLRITIQGSPVSETANFVAAFDFSISANPSTLTIVQTGSGSSTVTVSLASGSPTSTTVTLSVSAPSGISGSLSSSSGQPTFSSTLTLSVSSSMALGTYTVTVTATGGGVSKSTQITVYVIDFSLSANPSTLSICRGASKTSTITVTLASGSPTTASVSLSASSSPSGLSFSFNPSSGNPTFSSTLTITVPSSASLGRYTVTVTGSGAGISRSTTITVYINDFSISVNPTSRTVTRPASGSTSTQATVSVTSTSGSASSMTVTLSSSGAPSGVTVTFSPNPVTVNPGSTASSTMTVTVSSSAPTGTYTITITGSSDCGTSKSTTYALTITESTYTVSFYVYDDAGSAVSGATINFAGSSYSHGGSTSVTAGTYSLSTGTIPSGYRFNKWDTGGSVSVASSTSSSTTATVSGSGSITMRLQRVATVTFSASGLGSDASGTVLNVDGTGYAYGDLPKSFTWDVGSQHSFTWALAAGSTTSGKAYVWVSTSGLSTSRSGTITIPSGGGSVTATYKTMYYLMMQVSPTGAGSVSPSSGWRDAGSSVSISATANSGYQFNRWSGSGTDSYSGTNNPASVTMNGPITETAIFKVGITFDALKTSGARFNSNPTYSVLYVAGNTYYYSQLPITFYWEVGSSHYVSWYGVYSDESTYLSGSDVDYVWSYSTGIFTSKSGTLTVPSSSGSVTAYYNRYVEVIVDKEPYNGGTVSPSSDWYLEGQTFTATANSGYQFHHWSIDNGASTSTSNPYYAWNPHYLKAVFYIPVRVYAYDSEYNTFPNIYVSCGPASGYTNSYGYVDLYVPYGYNTLSISSSGAGYGGKSLPFWKWGDGSTSTSRTIYVYRPTYYTAYYKCVLWFKEIYAEHRCGPGTWFADVYRTWGYVHVTTARSEYSKSSINVKAVWHIHTEDLFGSHYYTREATGTTNYNGYFDFSTSGYDYFEIFADLWVEVSTQAEERYVNAYWTARYPFS